MTMASYLSARSQILSSWATVPSIEKTPSVAIMMRLAPAALASSSWAFRSAMSLFA